MDERTSKARRLRVGDRLREVDGTEAVVAGLRRNVGQAVVYTLTVAKDHTFFVGAARVLVHNASPCPTAITRILDHLPAALTDIRGGECLQCVRTLRDQVQGIDSGAKIIAVQSSGLYVDISEEVLKKTGEQWRYHAALLLSDGSIVDPILYKSGLGGYYADEREWFNAFLKGGFEEGFHMVYVARDFRLSGFRLVPVP